MAAKENKNRRGVKSYFWLFMAVVCIVFSSASKKVIEQKVNPDLYYSALSFNKKIKDGSRERHEYLAKVTHTDNLQSPDNAVPTIFFLATLFPLAFLFFSRSTATHTALKEQHLSLVGVRSLYLRDHRLEV